MRNYEQELDNSENKVLNLNINGVLLKKWLKDLLAEQAEEYKQLRIEAYDIGYEKGFEKGNELKEVMGKEKVEDTKEIEKIKYLWGVGHNEEEYRIVDRINEIGEAVNSQQKGIEGLKREMDELKRKQDDMNRLQKAIVER